MPKRAPREYNPFEALPKRRKLSEPAGAKRQEPIVGQVLPAKSKNPAYVQLNTYIPRDLHLRVKVKLVSKEREFSDLVEELLRKWDQQTD